MNESAPRDERGSGLVELALVLPVVLILTLAIVQFGVLGFAASAADSAARQGARVSSVTQAKIIAADGVPQTRNFYPAGDVDWVRLPIGPGTYVIATNISNNLYPDTVLTLFAANGITPLAINDDCTAYTRASCLAYISSVSTTLYLKVSPYDASSVGADSWYGLAVVKQ